MITAPRGTVDLLPPDSLGWQQLETQLRAVAMIFGFGEIRTPMFESTELFIRGVGESTDIVEKEMYTFIDKGQRSITLRPEWTAPVVRALLEHKRFGQGAQRLFYLGPFFRYERPQAGRLRQAHQFGVEFFGVEDARADAEVIMLAVEALRAVGIDSALLQLNSIGDPLCRDAYRAALLEHFRPVIDQLSEDSQRRLERNPLRILDSKAPEDQEYIAAAPVLAESLCNACSEHFAAVQTFLTISGIPFQLAPRLVRGFDYYNRTVFEISSPMLGAQTAICGGGRYDGLVQQLGGPATPAVGFGMGIERILMLLAQAKINENADERTGIQAICLGPAAGERLLPLVVALRRAALRQKPGPAIFIDYGDRKILAHYKIGDRNAARMAVVLGENELAKGELILRDLVTRDEEALPLLDDEASAAHILAWYQRRMKG